MSKKNKYRSPKFYEGIEDPELIDWEEDSDSDLRYDNDEQRCFPFPAIVIAATGVAAGCNPRFCNPNCHPNCNPRLCRPTCNPSCNPDCNPRFCNPNCNPRFCNPQVCNPNSCRPRQSSCRPAGFCNPFF